MHAIVAFDALRGIGRAGRLPWSLPEDLARFRTLTTGHVVVMGAATWRSLPRRPLPDRDCIVFTRSTATASAWTRPADRTWAVTTRAEFDTLRASLFADREIWIAGGTDIWELFSGDIQYIHATLVPGIHECDRYFPESLLRGAVLEGPVEPGTGGVMYVTYKRVPRGGSVLEAPYLDLLRDILAHGERRGDRTGTGTLGVFGRQMRFDLSEGRLPLLTTKYVPFRSCVRELLWFLRGDTDARRLRAQGVRIWDANTSRDFLDARGLAHYREGDMGPMYGFQWRHFGATYAGPDADYTGQGRDQLAEVIRLLREEPTSRRIAMTTYNPADLDRGVLHPCHGVFVQFCVSGSDGSKSGPKRLSCMMTQRSMDTFLGAPWNIASYAVLTCLLAKMTGLQPGELIISAGDAHIYLNHVDQVRAQLERTPLPSPRLVVSESVASKTVDELTEDDVTLEGYIFHPALRGPMAV